VSLKLWAYIVFPFAPPPPPPHPTTKTHTSSFVCRRRTLVHSRINPPRLTACLPACFADSTRVRFRLRNSGHARTLSHTRAYCGGNRYPWCHVWLDGDTGDVVNTHGVDRDVATTLLDPRGANGAKEGAFIVRAAETHGRHSDGHILTISVVVCTSTTPRRAEVRHYPVLRDPATRTLRIATGPPGSAAVKDARRFNSLADLVVYYTRNPISKPKGKDTTKPLLVPHRAPALKLAVHPLKRVAPIGFCDITFVL
jgi:hypothetical protein